MREINYCLKHYHLAAIRFDHMREPLVEVQTNSIIILPLVCVFESVRELLILAVILTSVYCNSCILLSCRFYNTAYDIMWSNNVQLMRYTYQLQVSLTMCRLLITQIVFGLGYTVQVISNQQLQSSQSHIHTCMLLLNQFAA